jgi:hypothetical protein
MHGDLRKLKAWGADRAPAHLPNNVEPRWSVDNECLDHSLRVGLSNNAQRAPGDLKRGAVGEAGPCG